MRLLTILILSLITATWTFGQTNKPCYDKIYEMADTLPVLVGSLDKVLLAIKNEVIIPDSLQNQTGHILIKYVVNCNGDVVSLRKIKLADSDGKLILNKFEYLTAEIISVLRQELKWVPAIHGGKAVDFLHIFSITFTDGRISINTTGS
jgi:hypothetical protein